MRSTGVVLHFVETHALTPEWVELPSAVSELPWTSGFWKSSSPEWCSTRHALDHRSGVELPSGAQKAGDARAWIDTPQPTRSTECEEDRTNSPGPLLHGRPGGRQESCLVWRLAGCRPLGVGGVEPYLAAPSAAPQTQNNTRPGRHKTGVDSLHHILCSAYVHSRNRTW